MTTLQHIDQGDALGLPVPEPVKRLCDQMTEHAAIAARQEFVIGYQRAIIDAFDLLEGSLSSPKALELLKLGTKESGLAAFEKLRKAGAL